MSYWHLYGGWLPKNESYRATVVHLIVNDEERPELTYDDDSFFKEKGVMIQLQLMATFNHKPSRREESAALPQLFRGAISDDWDNDEDVDEDEEDDDT